MELKITEQKENPVLSRTMIKFEIHQDGKPVPSRITVLEALASKLKKGKELIIIRKIQPDFGSSNIKGEATLYSSKKALDKIEPKYTLKRLEVKEKKTEETPQEQPAQTEEAPKEEKTEDKPAEKKEEPKEEAEKPEGKEPEKSE